MAESNLTGPEGILMLCVAGLLDAIGFAIFCICTWFGIDDYCILDIIGAVIIGGWLLMRTGFSGGTQDAIEKVAKKTAKRFGWAFGTELVPFLGGFVPSWTILVWKELKG